MFKFDPLAKIRKWLTTSKTVSTEGKWFADARSIYDLDQKFDYSTTEQVVGKWIDGKPLYQKTVEFTYTATSDYTIGFAELGFSDEINEVISIKGYATDANGWRQYFNTCQNYNTLFFCDTNSTLKQVYFSTGSNIRNRYNGVPAVLTMLYTKTTD